MNLNLRFLLRPIAFLFYGLLALAALIWWIGPLIPWGEGHPLAAVSARLWCIAALLLFFVLMALLGAWRRKRANAAMLKELKSGPSATDRETQVLNQRFAEALQVLEDGARKNGRRSLFKRQQYLYEMPWYMFVGAPGSGKTTALLNAGLTFPLAGKMGQVSVKGVGGTRNCDWWFSEEAVFIDTAGRYALQQSDAAVDAAGWANFLTLLKRARPLRPLNGVLLTVNIQDLLQQSPAERREHAAILRTRLQELHQQLGVRPPVYVLVTKSDLIAGFNESFGDLAREERDQVWGMSFPYDPRGIDNAMQDFGNEFSALEKRLRERLMDLMERENDVLRRAAIFSFPTQFAGLKGLLGGFLEAVFVGGGTLEERSLLRGVYFTSGTQEGTPIDRVLGTLARTFGVERQTGFIAAARGKSFFLTRLLKEVVFAEQGLVGENRQVDASRRRWRRFGMSAILLISLALIAGWSWSYLRNKAYVAEVQERLPALRALVDSLAPAPKVDMALLPVALDQVLAAPLSSQFELERPPLFNTLGLYQGEVLAEAAQVGYHRLLGQLLLAQVQLRNEERLRGASRDNLEFAYEALKAYLMLYLPEHFEASAALGWITMDWDTTLSGKVSSEQRVALVRHLVVALQDLGKAELPPRNAKLVEKVREMLIAFPLEYRIFSRLKRTQGGNFPDFSVASAGGLNAVQVFERVSGEPITKGVPGLFTRNAYIKSFRGSIAKATKLLEEEQAWVLNIEPANASASEAARQLMSGRNDMESRVRRLYLQEYINAWDQYLADVRLVQLDDLQQSLAVARLLAAADSPIGAYMRAVARETSLAAAVTEADAKLITALDEKTRQAKSDLGRVVSTEAINAATGAPNPTANGGKLLEALVDDHFASVIRMVEGQPAPIEEVLKLFNDTYNQLSALDSAQRGRNPPPPIDGPGSATAIKIAAELQNEPIRSMLTALSDMNTSQSRRAVRVDLTSELRPLSDFCTRAIAGRYPFVPSSKTDVLPDDFGQLFGVGGMMDQFYQKRLASLVNTGGATWSFKPLPDGSMPPGGAALGDFQRAAAIRDAFFHGGGRVPGFKVDLRLLEMSEDLKEMTLDIDGQVLKFSAGNAVSQSIEWPGKRLSSTIKLSMPGMPSQTFEGPWALFRLLKDFDTRTATRRESMIALFNLEGRTARMQLTANSTINPLRMTELSGFRCPSEL